jgi:hypothetical protein
MSTYKKIKRKINGNNARERLVEEGQPFFPKEVIQVLL